MSKKFSDFLNSVGADADRIQQALRIYLSERTEDLTPNEMASELREKAVDARKFTETLRELELTPEAVEQAALLYFESEWEDEERQPAIRAVFESAKNQLPVVETAILAIAAMYAVHILVTGGVTKKETRTRRKKDGTFETVKVEEVEPFHRILNGMPKLFGAATKLTDTKTTDGAE